jgi:lipopolysaccharide export system protein LptA
MHRLGKLKWSSMSLKSANILGLFLFWLLLAIFVERVNAAPSASANPKKESKQESASSKKSATAKSDSSIKDAAGFDSVDKDAPVYIKSKTLELNAKERVFIYKEEVEIAKGDLLITADKVIGTYDDNNRLQKIVCEKNVVITRGETLRATSDHAEYLVGPGVIELTEGPDLLHRGNALSADKVTIFVNEDRSEASGNVRVKVIETAQPTDTATISSPPSAQ